MGRVANPKLVSLWRGRVDLQRRSGLSILAYCRREGFSAGSFYAWKRRLSVSRSTVVSKSKKQVQQGVSRHQSPRGGFVQFPLTVDSTVVVRFADGTTVSVSAEKLSVTLQTLQALQLEGAANA